jgi:acetyl-CoA C-acetyltransferase
MEDPIVIVGGARTAIGTFGGAFKNTPAYKLGAAAVRAALARAQVTADEVDEVVLGCVGQVGPDAFNARRVALEAGLPAGGTAYNVNRLCGSGLQSIWSAMMQIEAGEASIVVAGGNENMSMQPFLNYQGRAGYRLGHHTLVDGTLSLVTDPWGNYPMGVTAENVANRFKVSREEQDAFALVSQQRAARALKRHLFDGEIVPIEVTERRVTRQVRTDEHPRPDTTAEGLARLKPAFREDGTVTAGNSSGINDAAAAVILMKESVARATGRKPLARLLHVAKAGVEPEIMGYAPASAISRVLSKASMTISDIGVAELNEAFAAQAVAVIRDAGLDPELTNPNGGAIALGHPIGATGTILVIKLMAEMQRRSAQFGLVTMCIGGGQALAAIIELVAD